MSTPPISSVTPSSMSVTVCSERSTTRFTMDQVDSMEDWIAIKEEPFAKSSATRVRHHFHVAWNDVAEVFAITCREHQPRDSTEIPKAWTGEFTVNALNSIHEQLCLIRPSLGPYLPHLPCQTRGFWAYFSHSPEELSDNIEEEIVQYLQIAVDICGRQLLTETLFEDHSQEEYFEKISELKRRVYDEAVKNADEQLKNVLFLRDESINMLDMCEVYKQEDAALFRWHIAQAGLYNYMIQPFLDIREVAFLKAKEAKEELSNPNLGERRKRDYAAMLTEWHQHYVSALDRIQEFYIEYYSKTVRRLGEVQQRMREDKQRFGQKAFEVAAQERYLRIVEDLSQEKLQLLENEQKTFENQRDKVKQEIASLEEKPGGIRKELERLERSVYDWQVKVLGKSMDILDEQERKLKIQMEAVKFELQATEDEGQFFDAVESIEDFSGDDEEAASSSHKQCHPRLRPMQNKLRQLYTKRAAIRNRKRKLMNKETQKKEAKVETARHFQQHHSIQIKRDEQKVELQQKQEFINSERRKTLERLRKHRLKYPAAKTIKPPRYQTPSERRCSQGAMDTTYTSMVTSPSHASDSPDGTSRPIYHPREYESMTASTLPSFHPAAGRPDVPPPPMVPPFSPPPPPPGPPPPGPPPPPPPGPPPLLPEVLPPPVPPLSLDMPKESTPGPSDSALGQDTIQDALGKLKKTPGSHPQRAPSRPVGDPMTDLMSLIQRGVKLKPVKKEDTKPLASLPSDVHTQQLKEALFRMQKKLAGPSDGDRDDDGDDDDDEGDADDDDFLD